MLKLEEQSSGGDHEISWSRARIGNYIRGRLLGGEVSAPRAAELLPRHSCLHPPFLIPRLGQSAVQKASVNRSQGLESR